jgi:Bardet-Biedl syndrome 7 protein
MGGHLFVSGNNVFHHFEDCQDAGFYVSDETINLILALPLEKVCRFMFSKRNFFSLLMPFKMQVKMLVPILACQDRTLRILERGKLKYIVNITSIPSALVLMNGDGGESGWDVMFGTLEGKFGLITLSP